MDCQRMVQLISDYVDHELPLKEEREVEAHIRNCSACRSLHEDWQGIVKQAKSLSIIEPSEGLWLRLKDRVREETSIKRDGATPRIARKPQIELWPWPRRLMLALASAALVIIGLMLALTWRAGIKEKPPEEIALAEIRQAEVHYQKAIQSLDQIVTKRKASWDAQFTATFEANLKKIDQAISECQEAVREYPRDPEAEKFLLTAYSRKVDFLQEILQIRS